MSTLHPSFPAFLPRPHNFRPPFFSHLHPFLHFLGHFNNRWMRFWGCRQHKPHWPTVIMTNLNFKHHKTSDRDAETCDNFDICLTLMHNISEWHTDHWIRFNYLQYYLVLDTLLFLGSSLGSVRATKPREPLLRSSFGMHFCTFIIIIIITIYIFMSIIPALVHRPFCNNNKISVGSTNSGRGRTQIWLLLFGVGIGCAPFPS